MHILTVISNTGGYVSAQSSDGKISLQFAREVDMHGTSDVDLYAIGNPIEVTFAPPFARPVHEPDSPGPKW